MREDMYEKTKISVLVCLFFFFSLETTLGMFFMDSLMFQSKISFSFGLSVLTDMA